MGHNNDSIQLVLLIILLGILSLKTIPFGFYSADRNVRCIDLERKAILKLKQGLTDPSDWLLYWVGEDCCKWNRLGYNNITGCVNKLDLRNRVEYPFIGEINPSLLDLKDLVYLDLSMNNFGGVQLPSFIRSLEKLKYINLSSASFGGVIPHNLGNLSRVLYLDLSNDLDNPIKTDLQWLATISSLKYLNLGGVDLTNTNAASCCLPTVNMLPSLGELHLPSYGLSIHTLTLPSINFTSFLVLDLSFNDFNCLLPPWLFNLTELVMLDSAHNGLTGKLPDDLGFARNNKFPQFSYEIRRI